MNRSFLKIAIWVGLTVSIFSIFRWLFGLAMPEVALEFSLGITVVLVGGLMSGSYVSKVWFNVDERYQNILFLILGVFILMGCFAIGLLVNKMIDHTDFLYFSLTVMLLFLMSALMGALISLIRIRIKNRLQTAQRAMVHSKSELQLLQSQLSPHFLFNTLNNIYGLSLTDHGKVPPLLLKLAELLRYSVYETKEAFVPIQHELDYLKNYIDFEKIRLGDRLELKLNLEHIPDSTFKIAPMLLIVFVENAFKHSRNSQGEKIFIDISLGKGENAILFSVKNSYFRSAPKFEFIEKHSGFGLESVKKRLGLLYENSHDLKIQESDGTYVVNLRLNKR